MRTLITKLCALLAVCTISSGCRSRTSPEDPPADPPAVGLPRPPARVIVPPPSDVRAPPTDAARAADGVAYKVLAAGRADGKAPAPRDTVEVHYTAWTTDGAMVDSSTTRDRPLRIALGATMPGWSSALPHLTEGGRMRIWVPEELAYRDRPGAPRGTVVFDVELLSVTPR